MDVDARSVAVRYVVATVVLVIGLVAANTWFIKPSAQTPISTGADPGKPAIALPSPQELLVNVDGKERVACEPLCRIEAFCALRDKDACLQSSCEGNVRKLSTSDFAIARSGNCQKSAVAGCEEACWKQGECAGDHASDAACAEQCRTRASQNASDSYRQQRCVLESACSDIKACAPAN